VTGLLHTDTNTQTHQTKTVSPPSLRSLGGDNNACTFRHSDMDHECGRGTEGPQHILYGAGIALCGKKGAAAKKSIKIYIAHQQNDL